jgi:hypothetical protein
VRDLEKLDAMKFALGIEHHCKEAIHYEIRNHGWIREEKK